MPRRHAWSLLAVLLLSVLVRLPQLGRPLSKNHEFATGTALIVLDVWWERGFFACGGSPALTYTGQCDGEVPGMTYSFMQREGVRYYVSHLPLAYWAPYAVFRALDRPPSPIPLRLMNVLLHGLTVFFLYHFLRTMFNAIGRSDAGAVAWVASAFYLLMPAPLWYHGNVYMSDMAVQLPWAWALASGARVFQADGLRPGRIIWLLLAVAATALTEWLGLFAAAMFGVYAIVRARRTGDRRFLLLGIATVAVALVVAGGALWMYARIAGPDALWRYYTYRWTDRGTFLGGEGAPLSAYVRYLGTDLLTAWGPLLLILLGGAFIGRRKGPSVFPWSAIVWMAIPALVHVLLFLRYAKHEFAVLSLGFVLCTLAAVIIVRWRDRAPWFGNTAAIAAVALGIAVYTWINRPGDGAATGDAYAVHQQRGALIGRTAHSGEMILASGTEVGTQLMFYAHRNIAAVTEEEGEALMDGSPESGCSLIWFRFQGDSCTVRHAPHGP